MTKRSVPTVIRGKPLHYPAAVSSRYAAKLDRAVQLMCRQVQRELMRLFKSDAAEVHFAMDDTIAAQARFLTNAMFAKFDDFFKDFAKSAAERFTEEVNRASSSSVKFSLKELSQGLTINPSDVIRGPLKEALSATVTENVGLIKSIPKQYLTQVQGAVMRSITREQGLAYLVPFLQKQEGVTRRRAELISLDQTRKAYSNLNAIRMQEVGVVEYEWKHSRSSLHPRKYHQLVLDGTIQKWSDPPVADPKTGEKNHPGQAINCRCFAIPVVNFKRREK